MPWGGGPEGGSEGRYEAERPPPAPFPFLLQEGAVFKKPQRPGHRSRVPAMEGAPGKEPCVPRPSSAPDLLVS